MDEQNKISHEKKIQESRKEHAESVGRTEAQNLRLLQLKGDQLAEREDYRDTDGIEAVHLYLVRTHHWKPAEVRAMTLEDMDFALSEEQFS